MFAGVDPGTTVGYAILDMDGEVVECGSSKTLDINGMVRKLSQNGRIILVATDKKKTPKYITKFASSVGAVSFSPKEDLLVREKADILEGIDMKGYDMHAKDALASVVYAHEKYKGLIRKIQYFVKKRKIEDRSGDIIKYLLRNPRVNIVAAYDNIVMMDKKKEQIREKERKLNEMRKKPSLDIEKAKKGNDDKKLDVDRLHKEISLLKEQNKKLKKKIDEMEKISSVHNKPDKKTHIEKQLLEIIKNKERRFLKVKKDLDKKINEIRQLEKKYKDSLRSMYLLNNHLAIKKIKNLSREEVMAKDKIFGLYSGKDNIIFVENPNVFSKKIVEELKDNVKAILCKNITKNIRKILPFHITVIIDEEIKAENDYYVFIDKTYVDRSVSGKDILNKVLEDYKAKRND